MKKPKIPYEVYKRYVMEADEVENCFEDSWLYAGRTYAVSESQAINNVRHNTLGDISQYKPLAVGGHWATYYEWKAVPVGGW